MKREGDRMKKGFLGLAVVLGATAFLNAQENYSTSWSQHRSYVLNTTASGANVPGTVLNFPVLVRLSAVDSAVFTAAKAGGVDLRFTKANNTTRLQHEIESWNATGRTAAIWVKVDTVPGNATATLRMHWGNSGAADSSKGSAVFDTANGFEAVFHMNGASGDTIRDATANGYKGVPTVGTTVGSTAPKDSAGVIGSAKAFGGNNDDNDAGANTGGAYRLETAGGGRTNNSFNYVGNDAEFTLSVWTNFDAFRPTGNFSRRRGLITKASALTDGTPATADTALGFAPSNNDPLTQWYLRPNNVDRVMHVQRTTIPAGGTAPYSIVASGGVSNVLNNWNYVSYAAAGATANGNRFRLYNSTGTTTREINDEPGLNKDVDVFIGALAAGAGSKNNGMLFLNGMMDEVRISKVARDSNWVNLEYANQKAGQTLVSVAGPPTALDYSSDTAAYALGGLITPNLATVTGAVDSFTVAPALPAGLALNKTSGAITGTPTAITAAANYVVTAMNGFGTAKDTLRLSVTAPVNEDYTTWTQRDTLWLNTQTNGAGTTALVRDFPVLVRLDSSAFASVYTQSTGRGADLRFLKGAANVRLPHQIESWDSAGKKAAIWVLVDSVKPNDRTQTIRMLWGKAGAPGLSSGPSVFDTANGYVGVWHMGGSDTVTDATGNGFNGTNIGSTAAAGLLGPARAFNGTDQRIAVPHNAKFNIAQNLTLSVWINPATWEGSKYFVNKGSGQNGSAIWGLRDNSTGFILLETGPTTNTVNMADDQLPLNTWYYITGTYGGGQAKIYRNGVLMNTIASTTDLTTTNTQEVGIGRRSTTSDGTHWFSGIMDEVRVQKSLRDSNWIKMEYHNQKAGQNLVWLSQPPIVVGVGARNPSSSPLGFSVKPLGSGMLFQLTGTTLGGKIALMDIHGRTIWTGAFPAGVNQVTWNGVAGNGQAVSGGVYLVRVTLGAVNGTAKVLEAKVPFTP
jgi:hypothetical protein